MTARRRTPGPEHVLVWAGLAVAVALAGVIINVWRPLASASGPIVTDLDQFPSTTLAAVSQYSGPRRVAALVATTLTVLVPMMVVITRRGRAWLSRIAGSGTPSWWRGAAVAGWLTLLTWVAVQPARFWAGYVHEGQFDFRTQGLGGWARDQVVAGGVAIALAAVAGGLLLVFLARWPRSWPYRLTLAGVALTAVLVLVYPLAVEPLFASTRPLDDPALRARLEQVLTRAREGDLDLLVADASRRTTRVNAYVSGLGPTRRVVLRDTLLELPDDQVASVVAHELAHREHQDIPRSVLLTAAGLLPGLLLLSWVLRSGRVQATLGASHLADPRLVAVAVLLAAAGEIAAAPAVNWFSRRAEAAADERSFDLAQDVSAFIGTARAFTVRDLADPQPPSWTRILWGTHPTVRERIHAAVAAAERRGLPLPTLEALEAVEDEYRHTPAR